MFYSWAAVARMREQKGLGAQAITATQLFALVSFSNCRAAGGQPCAAPRLARTHAPPGARVAGHTDE